VAVESEKGKGSVFTLSLAVEMPEGTPLIEPNAEVIPPAAADDGAPRVRLEARILVADDRRDIQAVAKYFLERAGASVTMADDGRQAVEAALQAQSQGAPFHAILMDMQMPKLNGFEAVAELRQNGYRRPIIALTAGAMKGDREDCLRAGCDEYLSKPIDGRVLVETVSRFVPHRLASPPALSLGVRSEHPRRVLIVDDSRDAATALSRLLEMSGTRPQSPTTAGPPWRSRASSIPSSFYSTCGFPTPTASRSCAVSKATAPTTRRWSPTRAAPTTRRKTAFTAPDSTAT
jgi:CheY-like chemotaxis protein